MKLGNWLSRPRLVVLSASVALAGLAVPGRASTVVVPYLNGTTTVVTARSLSLPFRLPQTVRVNIRDWTITGGGRGYGMLLRKDGPDPAPALLDMRNGKCLTSGCRPMYANDGGLMCSCGKVGGTGTDTGEASDLPAGRYHLYIVADGTPTTVTLHLHGLAGSRTWRAGPLLKVTFDAPSADPNPVASTPQAADVYSAGVRHGVGAHGGVVMADQWKVLLAAPKSVNEVGTCQFRDDGFPAAAVAPYQTGCGGHYDDSGVTVSGQNPAPQTWGPSALVPEYVTGHKWLWALAPGHLYGVGGSINGLTPSLEAHTMLIWWDYSA